MADRSGCCRPIRAPRSSCSFPPPERASLKIRHRGDPKTAAIRRSSIAQSVAQFLDFTARESKVTVSPLSVWTILPETAMSILIRGGTVINHDHSRRADVLIEGDTIAAIGPAIAPPSG